MEQLIISLVLSVAVATVTGLAIHKLTKNKPIAQLVMTLVFLGMMFAIVVPAFMKIITEIAMKPAERARQQQEIRKMAETAKIQKERELMKGVHKEMQRQAAMERAAREKTHQQHLVQYQNRINSDELFERWYQPLESCKDIKEINIMMCTNHRIRERSRFETLYKEGKIALK